MIRTILKLKNIEINNFKYSHQIIDKNATTNIDKKSFNRNIYQAYKNKNLPELSAPVIKQNKTFIYIEKKDFDIFLL